VPLGYGVVAWLLFRRGVTGAFSTQKQFGFHYFLLLLLKLTQADQLFKGQIRFGAGD
jgi:hypothetical protein